MTEQDKPQERPEGPAGPIQPSPPTIYDLVRELPSSQPLERGAPSEYLTDILFREFDTRVVSQGQGEPTPPPIQVKEGLLIFNQDDLKTAAGKVWDYFKKMVQEQNASEVNRFLWYLEDNEDENIQDLCREIQDAIKSGDTSSLQLDSLKVHLPTRALGERQLIKRALKEQIPNLPFDFLNQEGAFGDRSGLTLACDPHKVDGIGPDGSSYNDVEFVFVKENGRFKLVISSPRGIGPIRILDAEKIDDYQYPILPETLRKDEKTKAITFQIGEAKRPSGDGTITRALFDVIEIRREPIDSLARELEEMERNIEQEYAPVPQSIPSPYLSPRSTRGTTWVTTSH